MSTLGSILKEHRQLNGFTLREVEEATDVSNAYLSQLESDKIKKPSANTLYKLSGLYRIDMDSLMLAAGIIKEKIQSSHSRIGQIPISRSEEEELIEYLKWLRFKNKQPKP